MNILAAYVHWPLSAAQHYVAAFRRLGHSVLTVGPVLKEVMENGYWALERDSWWPDVQIGEYGQGGWATTPLADLLAHLDEPPDLIISPSGFFALTGPSPVPHVLISFEPHGYNGGYDQVEEAGWTHEFTADPQNPRLGRPDCYYLPMGYDPTLHRAIIPWRRRPLDLTFVGVLYDDRLTFAKRLLSRGLLLNAAKGIDWQQYVTMTNSGRCAINIPNHVNTGVSNRVYEALAMDAIYLSPPYPALAAAGLEAGVHYLPYQTEDDVVGLMERIKEEKPTWGEAVVERARAWVQGQTYDTRCERILEVVCAD